MAKENSKTVKETVKTGRDYNTIEETIEEYRKSKRK